jgi:hypothetical protein
MTQGAEATIGFEPTVLVVLDSNQNVMFYNRLRIEQVAREHQIRWDRRSWAEFVKRLERECAIVGIWQRLMKYYSKRFMQSSEGDAQSMLALAKRMSEIQTIKSSVRNTAGAKTREPQRLNPHRSTLVVD